MTLVPKTDIENNDIIKFCVLCNRIAQNVVYDLNGQNSAQNLLGNRSKTLSDEIAGSVTGRCTCRGYSGIVKDCCNLLGIESNLVHGCTENFGYMWNQVKLNGNWYNVDLTWDKDFILRKEKLYWFLKSNIDFEGYGTITDSLALFHKDFIENRSNEYDCKFSVPDVVYTKYLYFEELEKKNWLNSLKQIVENNGSRKI